MELDYNWLVLRHAYLDLEVTGRIVDKYLIQLNSHIQNGLLADLGVHKTLRSLAEGDIQTWPSQY